MYTRPHLIWAIIKSSLGAPNKFVSEDNKTAKMYNSGEVQNMMKSKKKQAEEADTVVRKAREFLQKLVSEKKVHVHEADEITLIGLTDCRCVQHLHEKKYEDAQTFRNFDDIGVMFYEDVCSKYKAAADLTCPWTKREYNDTKVAFVRGKGKHRAGGVQLIKWNKDGTLSGSQSLGDRGFHVDGLAVHKESNTKFKILSLNAKATLLHPECNKEKTIPLEELLTLYKGEEDDKPRFLDAIPTPLTNRDYALNLAKTWFRQAQDACQLKHSKHLNEDLQIQTDPIKAVYSLKDKKEGELQLVPLCNNPYVATEKDFALRGPQDLDFGTIATIEGTVYKCAVNPRNDLPDQEKKDTANMTFKPKEKLSFVVPAFAIRQTHDSAKANMKMDYTNGYTHSATGIKIPLMRNIKPLKKFEELFVYQPQTLKNYSKTVETRFPKKKPSANTPPEKKKGMMGKTGNKKIMGKTPPKKMPALSGQKRKHATVASKKHVGQKKKAIKKTR